MKKLIYSLVVVVGLSSCGGSQSETTQTDSTSVDSSKVDTTIVDTVSAVIKKDSVK
jgi:hypothetical protein